LYGAAAPEVQVLAGVRRRSNRELFHAAVEAHKAR